MGIIDKSVFKTIEASCEVFFPENDEGVPDYRQTNLAQFTYDYLMLLPPKQIFLLKMFYILLGFFPQLLFSSFRKLHNLSPEKRSRLFKRIEKSKIYRLRLIIDGLKANLRMIYLNRPEALAFVGEYRLRKYENDSLEIETRPEAYANRDKKIKVGSKKPAAPESKRGATKAKKAKKSAGRKQLKTKTKTKTKAKTKTAKKKPVTAGKKRSR